MCRPSRPGESEDQGLCQGMQLDHTMQRQPGFLFCFVFVGVKNENKEPF